MKQWPCEREEEEEEEDEKTQRHSYNLEEVKEKNNTMFVLVEGKEKNRKGEIPIVWFQGWEGNLRELKRKCFSWAHKFLFAQIGRKSNGS